MTKLEQLIELAQGRDCAAFMLTQEDVAAVEAEAKLMGLYPLQPGEFRRDEIAGVPYVATRGLRHSYLVTEDGNGGPLLHEIP